jgi:hypothetical protein
MSLVSLASTKHTGRKKVAGHLKKQEATGFSSVAHVNLKQSKKRTSGSISSLTNSPQLPQNKPNPQNP